MDFFFSSVTDLPPDSRTICWRVAFPKAGVLIAAENDFLAVSLEAGLEIDQFLLSPREPIALCGGLGKIDTLLRRAITVAEVPLGQSQLSFDWIFNAIIIINRSDILPKHAVIELPMFIYSHLMTQMPWILSQPHEDVPLGWIEANLMILIFELLVYLVVESDWGGFHAIFY